VTDGWTDTACRHIPRLCTASRGKNYRVESKWIKCKLQCVLNAAARLVPGTRKFDHGLSHLLHEELHWLDVLERIQYKLGVTVHRCLQNEAPEYLVNCCTPVSDIPSRRHWRSATRHHLTTNWESTYHVTGWTLSVVGPSLSQVRQSGTRYRTVSVTRRSAATVSDNRQIRIYNFVATTQHTQCSRDASWLCAI